jgi:hypothetical protein
MSPDQTYREKAAWLRAAAQETSNFAISVELYAAADRYDRLADVAENDRVPKPNELRP